METSIKKNNRAVVQLRLFKEGPRTPESRQRIFEEEFYSYLNGFIKGGFSPSKKITVQEDIRSPELCYTKFTPDMVYVIVNPKILLSVCDQKLVNSAKREVDNIVLFENDIFC